MRVLRIVGAVALWIVNILAAAAFVAIGVAKFGLAEWAINFARWGYPDGFYMVIGALEIAGGVLLLVPRLSSYAASLLGAILIGAAATHALNNEAPRCSPADVACGDDAHRRRSPPPRVAPRDSYGPDATWPR